MKRFIVDITVEVSNKAILTATVKGKSLENTKSKALHMAFDAIPRDNDANKIVISYCITYCGECIDAQQIAMAVSGGELFITE